MTRTRLDRFGMAVAITVSLAGSITPTQATPLDIKPNDALEGITSMVFTNERRTALDLIGYLRYNCIKSIRVPGATVTLVELERLISAADVRQLLQWAQAGKASYVLSNQHNDCQATADLNNGTSSSSTTSPTPPTPPPPTSDPD